MPKTNYEIALEVLKIDGSDFICGLTVLLGASLSVSLWADGWGGTVVAGNLSRTPGECGRTPYIALPEQKWFKVRMRVTPGKLEAWLDEKKVVDQVITNRKISLRYEEMYH